MDRTDFVKMTDVERKIEQAKKEHTKNNNGDEKGMDGWGEKERRRKGGREKRFGAVGSHILLFI